MNHRIQKGQKGESLTVNHLLQEGYTIVAQNYRKRFGEIDIIAKKNDIIAFVEVKWRHCSLVDPAELIGPLKQKKIIATAKEFVSKQSHINLDIIYRFDVALIEETHNSLELRYIPNAFNTFD